LVAACIIAPSLVTGSGSEAGGAAVPPPSAARYGWDYNLTKRCAKTPSPRGVNYYEDTTGCDAGSAHKWLLAVESGAGGSTCPGIASQSYLFNGPNSPVSISWTPHVDEFGNKNWMVSLSTDFITHTQTCSAETKNPGWTWVMFQDQSGPHPKLQNFQTDVLVNFSDETPNGNTRAFISSAVFWDGKMYAMEISVSTSYDDGYPDDPYVMSTEYTSLTEFVTIDGRALGIAVEKNRESRVTVDWFPIYRLMVDRGFFTAPSQGWDHTFIRVGAAGIGTETYTVSATNAAAARLSFTNFRVKDTSAAHIPPASPPPSDQMAGSAWMMR
jgi:hypothetical protein